MLINRDTVIYSMSKDNVPTAKVSCPCHLVFEVNDCFHGQIIDEGQRLDEIDFSHINPATGPVYIEGAEEGDALAVHIQSIHLAKTAVVLTIQGEGILPDSVQGETTVCPIHDSTFTLYGVDIPLNPMIGVIGVAPKGEGITCGTPGNHGGNMDTATIGAGATLFLPVFVRGALLAMGDLHAAMGDGEVGVSGLEVAGSVKVSVDVKKQIQLPCPLLKSKDELAFVVSAETTDEAIELSIKYMHEFFVKHSELDADKALAVMSLCGNARISQLVDPLKTARFCMPLDILQKYGVSLAF